MRTHGMSTFALAGTAAVEHNDIILTLGLHTTGHTISHVIEKLKNKHTFLKTIQTE